MKKVLISIGILAVLLVVGFFALNQYIYNEKQGDGGLVADYKTAAYFISGAPVFLGEGGVTYFGNEVRADLDGDGDEDIAFLITQQPGGSGTFYFLAGAINEGGRYKGTNAMLIGDRIAPQTTEFKNGQVIINYADRAPREPFTTPPSVGKSLYAKYSSRTNDFGEVVQNFEGESR